MKHFLFSVAALALVAVLPVMTLAQAPTPPRPATKSPSSATPPAVAPSPFNDEAPVEESSQVRRPLAAPLHNQYGGVRRPQFQIPEELKAEVVTPEMWLYMQEMRRYDDPLQAVRRHAADRAAHRRARLAAMQWFGYSNTRPQANPMPMMDTYSPMWVSNSWNPYAWIGSGHGWTPIRVETYVR
jgi:hypothetical protein